MNFKVCFDCKKTMTWFDVVFTFLRIKVPKDNASNYHKFNIENGDYLIDFRPNIYCNYAEGNFQHFHLKETFRMLDNFYFNHPELLKHAILKKYDIKKNKIELDNEMEETVSLFFKRENNQFYCCCDANPSFLNKRLLDYFKFLETNMFPCDECQFQFEHIVFGKELK